MKRLNELAKDIFGAKIKDGQLDRRVENGGGGGIPWKVAFKAFQHTFPSSFILREEEIQRFIEGGDIPIGSLRRLNEEPSTPRWVHPRYSGSVLYSTDEIGFESASTRRRFEVDRGGEWDVFFPYGSSQAASEFINWIYKFMNE